MILLSSDHHHHDYKAFSIPGPEGISSRLLESLLVEEFISKYMQEKGITFHLRLGDLFDEKYSVDAIVFNEVANILRFNQENGVAELVLVGNHDQARAVGRNTLESLAGDACKIISKPELLKIRGIEFYIVPHVQVKNAHKEIFEAFGKRAKESEQSVLLAHTGIHGTKSGSEFVLSDYISTEDLFLGNYTQAFFGHVHEPQDVTENSRYLGSLTQRSFSDCGSPRRMLVLNDYLKITEVPLPGPRFYNIQCSNIEDLPEVEGNGYYKINITSIDVDPKKVDAYFDGRCKGWIMRSNVTGERFSPRLSSQNVSYLDIFADYIKQTQKEQDQAQLLKMCEEAIAHVG